MHQVPKYINMVLVIYWNFKITEEKNFGKLFPKFQSRICMEVEFQSSIWAPISLEPVCQGRCIARSNQKSTQAQHTHPAVPKRQSFELVYCVLVSFIYWWLFIVSCFIQPSKLVATRLRNTRKTLMRWNDSRCRKRSANGMFRSTLASTPTCRVVMLTHWLLGDWNEFLAKPFSSYF